MFLRDALLTTQQAYTHARNAAQETKRSNPVAASEEHDLAAAEFAAAAQTTTDKEALRVLKLLEAHHRQLGQILKDAHSGPSVSNENQKTQNQIPTHVNNEARHTSKPIEAGTHPPRLSRTGGGTGRDLSSSIASNLASARGIPNSKPKRNIPVSPLVSSEHADGAFSHQNPLEHKPRNSSMNSSSSRPSWTPPATITAKPKADPTVSDAPFQQFYNKFEGLLSTLTAPLAFASLPLTQPSQKDETADKIPAPSSATPKVRSRKPEKPSSNIDYSSLISSAALRAVRDNNPSLKPHESFIHVPTSGGTMSYADITAQAYIDRQFSRQEHTHTHVRNPSSNSTDDFVDASSQILPDRVLSTATQPKYNGKTMEELHLENSVLKRTTNDMARRLMVFEFNAQNSSAALAQSIRSLHLSPVTTPENSRGKMISVSGGHSNDATLRVAQERIKELEVSLQKSNRKLAEKKDENTKLKDTLGRYREKWDSLKAGAKARREQAAGGAGGSERTRKSSTHSNATNAAQGTGAIDIEETDVRSAAE